MTLRTYRRIVTGLNAAGESCAIIDGPVPKDPCNTSLIWRTETLPADNSGTDDPWMPFSHELLTCPGSRFILAQMPPGATGETFMHATNTIDYLAVMEGEVVLVLESGEVRLTTGDLIVDRGVVHGWRNDGDVPAAFISIMLPAHPVGAGESL